MENPGTVYDQAGAPLLKVIACVVPGGRLCEKVREIVPKWNYNNVLSRYVKNE